MLVIPTIGRLRQELQEVEDQSGRHSELQKRKQKQRKEKERKKSQRKE